MTDWLNLIERFQTGQLPKADWSHRAHLAVGLWYLLEYQGPEVALQHLRKAIMAFNESVGVQNTDTTGYHHTITRFWMYEIHGFVQRAEARDFGTLVEALVANELLLRSERFFDLYRRDVLKDPAARRGYIPPSPPCAPA